MESPTVKNKTSKTGVKTNNIVGANIKPKSRNSFPKMYNKDASDNKAWEYLSRNTEIVISKILSVFRNNKIRAGNVIHEILSIESGM